MATPLSLEPFQMSSLHIGGIVVVALLVLLTIFLYNKFSAGGVAALGKA